MFEVLNNREISIGIWLTVLILYSSFDTKLRSTFINLLKAFFAWKILVSIAAMFLYILIFVLVFSALGFWDITALKDTVYWSIGTAFVLLINSNNAVRRKDFFRKTIFDNLKLVLIIEFVINMYTFSLVWELIIVPVVVFLTASTYYFKTNTHRVSKHYFEIFLGVFGLIILGLTVWNIVNDFSTFASLKTLCNFALPPIFTISFMPFIYFNALFIGYEMLFVRIDIIEEDEKIAKYAKRRLFKSCRMNLNRLRSFSEDINRLRSLVNEVGQVKRKQ